MSDVYIRFPRPVREAVKYCYGLIPLRLRLGRKFFKQLDLIERAQWRSPLEQKDYQDEQLKLLVRHAYAHVPYYRDLFDSLNLGPGDVQKAEDLVKLPVLTKDAVRNNLQRLRADNFSDQQVVKLSTSGTTGKPLTLYYDKERDYLNFDPFVWRFFGWAGHKVGELGAKLSAWTLPSGVLYAHNSVRNLLLLSAYAMTEKNVGDYAQALREYGVAYLDGYPSSLELMVKYMKAAGIKKPVSLRAVFCHSECLHDWQRAAIEQFWGCRCFDWYGLEERVILGVECEAHKGLHLCSDFGITEFVEDAPSGLKRIIATSLTNYAMPMIRYDTEDTGRLLDEPCPCRRGFPLFKLEGGREKSFAIGKDGARIPVANIDIPNVTDHVLQFQFIQKEPGAMTLHIVKKDGFGDDDIVGIRGKLEEKFGSNMDVQIVFTDRIQLTHNGKAAIYIQQIKKEDGDGASNCVKT